VTCAAIHRQSARIMAVASERWTRVREYLTGRGLQGATGTEIAEALETEPPARRRLRNAIGWQRSARASLNCGFRALTFPGPSGHKISVHFTLTNALVVESKCRYCSICGDECRETEFSLFDQEHSQRSDICKGCARLNREKVRQAARVALGVRKSDAERQRPRIPICKLCCNLPHARPSGGCPQCGMPQGELPVEPPAVFSKGFVYPEGGGSW